MTFEQSFMKDVKGHCSRLYGNGLKLIPAPARVGVYRSEGNIGTIIIFILLIRVFRVRRISQWGDT
jgi:hypothetical protein